jgi:hypothetical protein
MNPLIWLKLRKYRPRIEQKGYQKRLWSYYGGIWLNSSLLLVNTFNFTSSLLYGLETNKFQLPLLFFSAFAVGILSFALWNSIEEKRSLIRNYSLSMFTNNIRKKIWKYLLYGGEIPTTKVNSIDQSITEGNPLIQLFGYTNQTSIQEIYQDYLKKLEPALEEGLNKPRFIKLKMLYG